MLDDKPRGHPSWTCSRDSPTIYEQTNNLNKDTLPMPSPSTAHMCYPRSWRCAFSVALRTIKKKKSGEMMQLEGSRFHQATSLLYYWTTTSYQDRLPGKLVNTQMELGKTPGLGGGNTSLAWAHPHSWLVKIIKRCVLPRQEQIVDERRRIDHLMNLPVSCATAPRPRCSLCFYHLLESRIASSCLSALPEHILLWRNGSFLPFARGQGRIDMAGNLPGRPG